MECLTEKDLEKAYKRLDEIDTELKHEYDKYEETCYASQLECEYERLEEQICEVESQIKSMK